MRVCMIGTGYVGLVTGACLAEIGHDVWCVDVDEKKIQMLQQGHIPIYEPGLEEIVKRNLSQNRLRFTTSLEEGLENSLFVFIAVGTPPNGDGSADLNFVFNVAEQIGQIMKSYKIVVTKSTVPVGTTSKIKGILTGTLSSRGESFPDFDVAFCPEFLKEGSAVEDFMKPDRIVLGTENDRTAEFLKELFAPFVMRENRILCMSVPSAELTKYAANAMLATRISFMNELARYCEKVGADIEEVRAGMGSDSRIGSAFLYPGIGYGGSCFPKDVKALIHSAKENGHDLSILQAVEETNKTQRDWFCKKILDHYHNNLKGKKLAVWGLSFKPHTDDMREAPSLTILPTLAEQGATFRAFDPVAMDNAQAILGDRSIEYCPDCYETLEGCDGLILMTEWPLFRRPDLERLKSLLKEPVIFDGRNQYNPKVLQKMGFTYLAVGRDINRSN
jgi:UDPglucose 6-dehydrogenase